MSNPTASARFAAAPTPGSIISQPLVTVVICAYNAGAYLREAVASALAQTYPNLEVLVIDDGSTDAAFETVDSIQDSRLRIIHQENRGKPASLNRALDEMRGEFYAILDADDLCRPTRVEAQARALIEDPELAAVFCGVELIIDGKLVAPRFAPRGIAACRADLAAMRMPGHDPSGMYRTALAREVRYRDTTRTVDGYDFILRLGERVPRMCVLGECLYQYRIHLASDTKSNPAYRIEAVHEVQSAACERRGLPAPPTPNTAGPFGHRELDNNVAAHFMESAVDLRGAGRTDEAIRVGLRCAALHPFDAYYYRALLYALLPSALTERLRARFGSSSNG